MGRPAAGYTLEDGTPVPGVTTICGQLDKPALVGWAGKTMHAAAIEYGRDCYRAAKEGESAPGLARWGDILYGQRDAAADAGTQAHDAFERHLLGQEQPEDMPDTVKQALANAVEWLSSTGMEVIPHERPMVSQTWGFGGTPDATGILADGRMVLLDWKTGKGRGLYLEHIMQLAAYRELLAECEGESVQSAHLVRFGRDHGDFSHHYIPRDALDLGWRAFKLLLELRPLTAQLRERCK